MKNWPFLAADWLSAIFASTELSITISAPVPSPALSVTTRDVPSLRRVGTARSRFSSGFSSSSFGTDSV